MSCSLYKNQVEELSLQHGTIKNYISPLKFLNANCTETRLMLNRIEEEVNDIEQRIAVFDNFIFKDNIIHLKVYQDNDQALIKNMIERIYHDLSQSCNELADLVDEQISYIDTDTVPRKRAKRDC